MMGVYFAATGLGNKVAGAIGEASQTEPVKIEFAQNVTPSQLIFANTDSIAKGTNFNAQALAYVRGNDVVIQDSLGTDISSLLVLDEENKKELVAQMSTEEHSPEAPLNLNFEFESAEAAQGDISTYSSKVEVFEVANKRELRTFLFIFLFTLGIGLVVIALLKRLKKLTHGIEEAEK